MLRLSKFNLSQKMQGFVQEDNTCSDDVTSMAEIVKRFFNNEPIPQMQEDENWQYEDSLVMDANGQPKVDANGRYITEEVLNNETLELIPITPNLDNHEICDDDDLNKFYDDATDRARAIVRQRNIELENARVKAKAEEKARAIQEFNLVESPDKTSVSQKTTE